MKCQCYTV